MDVSGIDNWKPARRALLVAAWGKGREHRDYLHPPLDLYRLKRSLDEVGISNEVYDPNLSADPHAGFLTAVRNARADIVGFSTICPHKGYPLAYNANDKTLNCSGHYSRFDCENGGQEIWGHATQNLPQYLLRVDAKGDIYAEGIDELLYGRLSNVLEG